MLKTNAYWKYSQWLVDHLGHQAIACIVVLFSQNALTYFPEINRVKFCNQWRLGNNLYYKLRNTRELTWYFTLGLTASICDMLGWVDLCVIFTDWSDLFGYNLSYWARPRENTHWLAKVNDS